MLYVVIVVVVIVLLVVVVAAAGVAVVAVVVIPISLFSNNSASFDLKIYFLDLNASRLKVIKTDHVDNLKFDIEILEWTSRAWIWRRTIDFVIANPNVDVENLDLVIANLNYDIENADWTPKTQICTSFIRHSK